MKDTLLTHHYINIAGVKYVKGPKESESKYYVLIHNSWGGSKYHQAEIFDGYVACNMLNGLFVIE